jgi:hypothetical protein
MENNVSDGYTAITAETEPLASELYIPRFSSDCHPSVSCCVGHGLRQVRRGTRERFLLLPTLLFFF